MPPRISSGGCVLLTAMSRHPGRSFEVMDSIFLLMLILITLAELPCSTCRRATQKYGDLRNIIKKKELRLRENLEQEYSSPLDLQKRELQELMITASATEFGKYYDFPEILSHFRKGPKDFYKTFTTPDTDPRLQQDLSRLVETVEDGGEERDLARQGEVLCTQLRDIRGRFEVHSRYQRHDHGHPPHQRKADVVVVQVRSAAEFFEGGILMVGGSTHLNKKGSYFEGDLSGIQARATPILVSALL